MKRFVISLLRKRRQSSLGKVQTYTICCCKELWPPLYTSANSSLPTTSRIWNTAVHNSITVMVAYCKTWHASSGMWFLFSQYELYWVILLLLWLFLQVVCNDILAKLFCLIAIISSVYMYTSLFIELLNPLSYLCIYTLQSGRFSCFAYTYT